MIDDISEEDNLMLEQFSAAVLGADINMLRHLVITLTIDGSQEEARDRIKIVQDFLNGVN